MDYDRKELVDRIRGIYQNLDDADKQDALRFFPELRESDDEDEDERTRKRLIEFISDIKRISESGRRSWAVRKDDVEMCDAFLSYLEKQKELPFVKDVMLGYPGLYFYDGERMHFQGPAMEEKQKEQKPAEINVKALLAADRLASAEMTGRLKERSEIHENPEKYGLQKPAEWSEEDEEMIRFYEADYNNQIGDMSMKDVIDMRLRFKNWLVNRLKSLRPQPHWKPSEEQIKALDKAIPIYAGIAGKDGISALISLYEQLKKLM